MNEVLWFLGECWKELGRPEQVQRNETLNLQEFDDVSFLAA